jgi:hypothetical protein
MDKICTRLLSILDRWHNIVFRINTAAKPKINLSSTKHIWGLINRILRFFIDSAIGDFVALLLLFLHPVAESVLCDNIEANAHLQTSAKQVLFKGDSMYSTL